MGFATARARSDPWDMSFHVVLLDIRVHAPFVCLWLLWVLFMQAMPSDAWFTLECFKTLKRRYHERAAACAYCRLWLYRPRLLRGTPW